MNEEPTVQIVQKGFFETRKGQLLLTIGIGVILFVILVFILNYFNVMAPALTGTPLKITLVPENYSFKAGELTFNCPVESIFCGSQKLVKIDNKDTVSYKAASDSAVLDLNQVSNLENIAVLTNKEVGKKYFYESTISKDGRSCQTISYTLPDDAIFTNILDLKSFLEGKRVATLGSKLFEIEGEDANVLIQIRNTPMDTGVPCSLLKKSPEFFKNL